MSGRSFLIYRPDGETGVFEVALPLIRIGRGDDNEIVLEDSSRSVSRFHAQLVLDSHGQAILTDLKSANGTFVNEQIVDGPVALAQDDVVRIGSYRLIFRDNTLAPPKPDEQPVPAYQIDVAEVELHELQHHPQLMRPSEGKTLVMSPELRGLELLHEVGVRLARTVTPEDVVETAVDLLFRIGGAHRATLMLWDDQHQAFRSAEVFARGGKKMSETPASFDPRTLVLS
jgi:hypothetical protein